MEAYNDNTLMEKVKNGDVEKLGLLFERYKKPLFGFFYGINRDAELSEDLVQNVFVRILKYRSLYRGEGEFRSWIFHIARNVSHDQYRRKNIPVKEPLEAWQDKLGSEENRMTEYQRDAELDLLQIAMDRLPADRREILLLSKYQEKKYKEIGEQLGFTEGAVKVKVFRAMQELKAIYHELEAKR